MTTISCTSATASTTMPKACEPKRMMMASLTSASATGPCSSLKMALRSTSGSTLSRSLSTMHPSMHSTLWLAPSPKPIASITDCCGSAKRCDPASTISAGAMASVSGISRLKLVPLPLVEVTVIDPPIVSMFSRTTSRPTPRPEMLVTVVAVENSGTKMKR